MSAPVVLDRRRMLAGWRRPDRQLLACVGFRAGSGRSAAAPAPGLPGSLKKAPFLDSWVRIDADGSITVFTGKAELGQGFKTAFQQIAAEELDVRFESLRVITADTQPDRQRRVHLRQPFRAGQRYRDSERRRAGP